MSLYVDVHCHLTDPQYQSDLPAVIQRAEAAGVLHMVVNGLDPQSNRETLALQARFSSVRAALGIYPIHAVSRLLQNPLPFTFDVLEDPDAEIRFIAEMAAQNKITAIGECGLDGHWLTPDTYPEQERVFRALIHVAKTYDLPVIVHSRKLEQRTYEILKEENPPRVVFHCWGGKVKTAVMICEHHDWCFSIPANAERNGAFTKMLQLLPLHNILTETDSPYLAPTPKTRNEPQNVVKTIQFFAKIRTLSDPIAKETVWRNYCRIFSFTH